MDFNGVVPEKFDVVNLSHQVQVEYGNVGVDFKFVPREGFGWMNASFEVGLTYLSVQQRRALGTCTDPDTLFKKMLEFENAKLSAAEKTDAMLVRRKSKLVAHEIAGGSEAVVTKIKPEDIIRQSISSPHPPNLERFFFPDIVDSLEEGDTALSAIPTDNHHGDTLKVPL